MERIVIKRDDFVVDALFYFEPVYFYFEHVYFEPVYYTWVIIVVKIYRLQQDN